MSLNLLFLPLYFRPHHFFTCIYSEVPSEIPTSKTDLKSVSLHLHELGLGTIISVLRKSNNLLNHPTASRVSFLNKNMQASNLNSSDSFLLVFWWNLSNNKLT